MRITARHVVIAILGGAGLYFAAIALAFFVGIVAGFVTYARPTKNVEVVRYVSQGPVRVQSAEPPGASASGAAPRP